MPPSTGIETTRQLLEDAVARRTFPCAVALVGSGADIVWHEAVGGLWFTQGEDAPPDATVATLFDLASLTKPLATTLVMLELASKGALDLEAPIMRWLPEWRTADRAAVTIADVMEHASGLPARLAVRPSQAGSANIAADVPAMKRAFAHAIATVPLEYSPRTRSIYSDLGFILLGLIVERVAGATLDVCTSQLFERLVAANPWAKEIGFAVPAEALARTAPTDPLVEDWRFGRRLRGEVHDDYAAALGGVAGHAGLFGTAAGVAAIARAVLRAAQGMSDDRGGLSVAWTRRAIQRSGVPGSSRALGWDRMLTTSSCGTRMSADAFGHVGFTGTSLWIDPARDRYYVLLTNRACGGGTLDDIKAIRRAFHDALADV